MALADRLMKYTLLTGILMMFIGCVQPLMADRMLNKKMNKPAHHQFTHNAEMLMALAFAFPYCKLSDSLLVATFCLLQSGACLLYTSPSPRDS